MPVTLGDFNRFIVDDLSGIFKLNKQNIVVNLDHDSNNHPTLTAADNVPQPISFLGDGQAVPKTVVINMFCQSVARTPEQKWLYTILSAGLMRRLMVLLSNIVAINDSDEDIIDNPELAALAAKFNQLSSKEITLIESISVLKNPLFLYMAFNRQKRTAMFRCSIFDKTILSAIKKTEYKSFARVFDIMKYLFGINASGTLEEQLNIAKSFMEENFSFKSNCLGYPELDSILNVMLKIYDRLNPFFAYVEDDTNNMTVDITSLSIFISEIDEIAKKTRWFGVSSNTKQHVSIQQPIQEQQTINGVPLNTTAVNIMNPQQQIYQQNSVPQNPTVMGMQQQQSNYYYPNNMNRQMCNPFTGSCDSLNRPVVTSNFNPFLVR